MAEPADKRACGKGEARLKRGKRYDRRESDSGWKRQRATFDLREGSVRTKLTFPAAGLWALAPGAAARATALGSGFRAAAAASDFSSTLA